MNEFFQILNTYGLWIIAIVMYLEALNLTGIPALVILPTIGFFITKSHYSFISIYILCILFSTLGAITYYFISYMFGSKLYDYFYRKFKNLRKSLNKASEISSKYGSKVCFFGRLTPGARTFISLISGILKVNFFTFTLYSFLGISVWTFILMIFGYIIGIYT